MRREPRRWSTRFGSWAGGYGVRRIAEEVGVSRWTVYDWIRGSRPVPERRAHTIESLSAGTITTVDVTRHGVVLETLKGLEKMP